MSVGTQKKLFSAERKRQEAVISSNNGAALGFDPSGVTNEDLLTAIKALQSEVIMRVSAQEKTAEKVVEAVSNVTDGNQHRDHTVGDLDVDEINMLRSEVRALSRSIYDTKREIKALGLNDEDKFSIVTNELDEIVSATERATETILNSAEKIDDLAQQLRQHSPDQFVTQLTDEILERTIMMFEACNFQDLCGQRTTKVVNSLKFIEERVGKMLEIWGEDSFDTVGAPEDVIRDQENQNPHGEILHGPAEHGGGISQADIDALFD